MIKPIKNHKNKAGKNATTAPRVEEVLEPSEAPIAAKPATSKIWKETMLKSLSLELRNKVSSNQILSPKNGKKEL